MHKIWFGSLLGMALHGCDGDKSTDDTGTDTDTDADADTDTDADSDTDTDTDTDTDSDTDTDTDASVVLLTEGYGHTLGEWGGIWWNWLYSFSSDASPILDTTDECDLNQPPDMFFLAGNFGGISRRTCTIPAGRPIFFPIDTVEYDNHGYPYDFTYTGDYLGYYADLHTDSALERTLTIDDQTWDLAALQVANPPYEIFVLTVPDVTPNILDWLGYPHWAGDLYPAVTDGVWVLIDPLPAGPHHIAFSAEYTTFALDIDYALTVE